MTAPASPATCVRLLPCPFCGGEPILNDPGGSQSADCYDITIRCLDCDAEVRGLVDQDYCDDGGAEVQSEVVAAWNRRTPITGDDDGR